MSIDSEVVLQILRRSPQGFTPFEILDYLLTQPQYQGCSRASLFSKLLPELQKLRDSQVVAHVSPRWVLVEPVENTFIGISSQFEDTVISEESNETEILNVPKEPDEAQVPNLQESTSNVCTSVNDKAAKLFSYKGLKREPHHVVKAPLDYPIQILNLSLRTYNALKRADINTIEELQACSQEYLLGIRNFGQKSLDEVRAGLANFEPLPKTGLHQDLTLLPEWAKHPAFQISTGYLSLPPNLNNIINDFPTVAHLICELEADNIALCSEENSQLKAVLATFQALRNAPQNYLEWLARLSPLTLTEVLTKHQWTPDRLRELSRQEIISAIPLDAREKTRYALIFGEIPSKPFATIAEEIDYWLDSLDDRKKSVLKQRLGLLDGNPRSLEDIGQELKLTRERVRQIESKAKNKLNHSRNTEKILPHLRQVAIETLHNAGCISTLQEWCESISQIYPPGEVHLPSVILWLINFIPEIKTKKSLISKNKFFYKTPLTKQIFSAIQAQIGEFWQEQRISDRSQLHQVILPLLPEETPHPEKVANLLISAQCYEPLPNIFSSSKWNSAHYIYYVLHRSGEPLHYSNIGDQLVNLIPNWDANDPHRAALSYVERHPEIIRCGSGIYGLREWGTMEYSHFREVLLDYLSKQPLPIDAEQIYADLSQSYAVSRPTVRMNLSFHPNLFKKFGSSNFYGVAGRLYELPDQELVNLLVAKLESGPVSLSELEQNPDFCEYDRKTLYLYLNVIPLFWQVGSFKERKFALSVDGKRQYHRGDASKIVRDIFNQIREPLHIRDFLHLIRNSYAYPPGEAAFWRTVAEDEDYITIIEAIFIPREWMSDETLGSLLEDLDTELFQKIVQFTLGSKRQQPPTDILFDWLSFCYQNYFYYRGSLIFAQINLTELSDKKAKAARQIGRVCQQRGDISVLGLGQDTNSEEVDQTLRLDLEDLRQQAQSRQRAPSKGLASIQDGKYRVRYAGVGVEVYLTKWGEATNPCARVLKVLVNGEPFDPSRHNPIPTNIASIDQRQEALQKLYAATLTAYGQVDPYLQMAIGSRPSWGISYRQIEPLSEPATGEVA